MDDEAFGVDYVFETAQQFWSGEAMDSVGEAWI